MYGTFNRAVPLVRVVARHVDLGHEVETGPGLPTDANGLSNPLCAAPWSFYVLVESGFYRLVESIKVGSSAAAGVTNTVTNR